MELKKKTARFVLMLVLLIALSASVPIVENNSTITTETIESREEKMIRYRLPNNTIPRLYTIYIEPNMDDENLTWNGKTSIAIQVLKPTPLLTLHAYKNLVIDEKLTKLIDTNKTKLTPVKHERDDEVQFLKLKFDHEIPVGNYTLSFKYEGKDTLDLAGFYKASDRVSPNIAATNFEPTAARRAFPCWDEPSLKSRFRVSIKHFSNYTALSNMPEVEHFETSDGKILTTFGTTPIMSTYVLTFVIGDYQNFFNKYRNVSLHTPKRSLEMTRHFLDLSPKVVEVMESYTGFPFGVPRIGSAMIPVFDDDGLEHWGLISYSEKRNRFNATADNIPIKDRTDTMIAHEVAHAWFGNRVTMLWWDDLWLNEAFATYFEYYIMDEIYKNWGGAEFFVVNNNQENAFPADNKYALPIRWTPITNEEIKSMFGEMTYRKGAAIVHMFCNVLGDRVFRAGIQKYMTKYSFKAAVADDLMTEFQEAYHGGPNKEKPLNLKDTMTPWLEHKGYPLVNVTRNYTTGETEVCQKSTIFNDRTTKWWIPLTYTTKSSLNFSSTSPTSWISDNEDCVKIGGIDKEDWIIVNIRASGYYRVNYDDTNWNRLAKYLNTENYTNIHVLNRAQLISDAFYLVEREPNRYYRIFYRLTEYLSREVEYLPWRSAYNAIKIIEGSLRLTDAHKMFVDHILELMHNYVEKVGLEAQNTDDHFTKLSRWDVIKWACIYGHNGCAEWSAQIFMTLLQLSNGKRSLPSYGNGWIVCAGLRGLNVTEVKVLSSWALMNPDGYLFSDNMGCTDNHKIHRIFLNPLITGNTTDRQLKSYHSFHMLLASSEENFNFAVDFFMENHQAVNKSLHKRGITNAILRIAADINNHVKSKARLEKFKQVLQLDAVLGDPKFPRALMMEVAEANVAEGDAASTLFWNSWDKSLATDIPIRVFRIDPH